MAGRQQRGCRMSSQDTGSTIAKKIAKVGVGKTTPGLLPALLSHYSATCPRGHQGLR